MTVKRMGDIQQGDVVRSSNGERVTVTQVYDEHIPDQMFHVELQDGTTINASHNHLWYVETDLDQKFHAVRLRQGKRVLKTLPQETFDLLYDLASDTSRPGVTLVGMAHLLAADKNSEMLTILFRIAESLGPSSEMNVDTTDDDVTYDSVRVYDGMRFAQQLLSLSNHQKSRKHWFVIVGRVVTTAQLMYLMEDGDVTIPDA